MGRPPNLWTVIHILWTVFIFLYYINLISDLCAVLRFYGPLSCSMCRYSALCAFISFYVPSFRSMGLHQDLWTVIYFLCPVSVILHYIHLIFYQCSCLL